MISSSSSIGQRVFNFVILDFQHLQVKLRKYVNNVKAQLKMEQLNKFKENMNLSILSPDCIRKSHTNNVREKSREVKQNPSIASKYQKMSSV